MTQHRLIAYRSDSVCATVGDKLYGEDWRDYIPIRLPWALCIRDRGTAWLRGGLAESGHQHRDLMLPINACAGSPVGSIDGERSLGDIVAGIERSGGAHRAVQFFQRLWRYDQIVFDASCTARRCDAMEIRNEDEASVGRSRSGLVPAFMPLVSSYGPAVAEAQTPAPNPPLPPLDQLVAPVALYPDALLAQVLTCATSPGQVTEMNTWVQQNSTAAWQRIAGCRATAGI